MLSADVMILLDCETWENELKFKGEEEKARNKRISQTNWLESQRRSWVPSVGELFLDYETRMKAIYNIHWEIFSATNSIIIQEKEKTFDRNTPWWKSQILRKVLTSEKGKWKWKQSDGSVFPQFARAPAGNQALKRAQCIPLPGFELLQEPVLPASCPRKAREVEPSITGMRKWKWNQLTTELFT